MKELVKFELEKIFSNKLIYLVSIAIITLILINPILEYMDMKKEFGGKENIENLSQKYISDELTKKEVDKIYQDAKDKYYDGKNLNKEEKFILKQGGSFSKNDGQTRVVINNKTYNYNEINNHLLKLKIYNKENTFEYKNFIKSKKMISRLSKPKSIYKGNWSEVLDLRVSAIMKVILLVTGLASIFSREYSTKVAYLNLSSKNGKTNLNTAKIIASLIYATVVFMFILILFHIQALVLGLPNGDYALNCLSEAAIYNLSIKQYYLISLGISYFGTIIFAILIMLTSLMSKNIIVSFGIPLVIYFLNNIIKISQSLDKYINNISLSKIIDGKDVFKEYLTFNVFGNPILYPYLLMSLGLMVLGVMLVVYNKISKNQTI